MLCQRVRKDGLVLCMHNHFGEFARVKGKLIHDWAAELAPDLDFELDVAGCVRAGIDPAERMALLSGRVPLVHFSDLMVIPQKKGVPMEKSIVTCPPGAGNLPPGKIINAAENSGVRFLIVEFPDCVDPFHAAAFAAHSIRKAGFADLF